MTTQKPAILLTGVTGYLGKHILWQLLEQGYQVTVIVRRKKKSPEERVFGVLKSVGSYNKALLDVIEGDVTESYCGIAPAELDKLAKKGISTLIHSAGLTRFDSHLSDEIFDNNLNGTKQAYVLAKYLGIINFHHISTAYVAGDTTKKFSSKDLELGQNFNNPYEASKYEAEKYLRHVCKIDAIRLVIYRPSIIVGGYPLGENNIVSTVYTFIKALHFIRECCRRDLKRGKGLFARCGIRQDPDAVYIPLRIVANAELGINLVSIDNVVDQVVNGLNKVDDKIISVVPLLGDDFSLNRLRDAVCNALAIKGISYVDKSEFDQQVRSVVEENFFRATSSYQPYLLSTPDFSEAEKETHKKIDIEKIAIDFIKLLDLKKTQKKSGDLNRLALNALGVSGAHDYFHRLINGQVGESFLRRIAYVDTKIRFLINGSQVFDQIIHFNKGDIYFSREPGFDCSYELSQMVFNDIVTGKTDLRNAFFNGKIKIQGDREIALKFGFLFSDHFLHIDDRVLEEVVGK